MSIKLSSARDNTKQAANTTYYPAEKAAKLTTTDIKAARY